MDSKYPHILVVDDDPDDHFFITRSLNKVFTNAIIRSAYNGLEAIDYLFKKGTYSKNKDKHPDLIFLDINMPKLNGIETTELIKKEKHLIHIPVIILSTSSNPNDKLTLLKSGAVEFYQKPLDLNQYSAIFEEVKNKWLK